jgi:predicted transcriptional regulator
MPETIDTAKEIVKIKHDIADIKQSQEADMHLGREKYERLVSNTLAGNTTRIKVFLEVDGVKSRKEIQDVVGGKQPTVWFAIDKLEQNGLIIKLEETKSGSPIYAKPRWVKTLRIDDYVRKNFPIQTPKLTEDQSQPGNSDMQPST